MRVLFLILLFSLAGGADPLLDRSRQVAANYRNHQTFLAVTQVLQRAPNLEAPGDGPSRNTRGILESRVQGFLALDVSQSQGHRKLTARMVYDGKWQWLAIREEKQVEAYKARQKAGSLATGLSFEGLGLDPNSDYMQTVRRLLAAKDLRAAGFENNQHIYRNATSQLWLDADATVRHYRRLQKVEGGYLWTDVDTSYDWLLNYDQGDVFQPVLESVLGNSGQALPPAREVSRQLPITKGLPLKF